MQHVLLGTLGPAWATRHDERVRQAEAKLDALGIRLATAGSAPCR